MNRKEWAENEVKIACKKENPNWDGESFDYGCSCYQSALKAYKSLTEDGHSGFSFGVTKNILIRLMNDLPLTAITEDDFNGVKGDDWKDGYISYQCPRMSSLFKEVNTETKEVTYSDVDRYYGVDENGHSYGGGGLVDLCNKLFPIKMPYFPKAQKYVFYTEDFLLDPKKGDYDHRAVLYVKTPEGDKIELDEFYKEENGKMVKISKKEYYKDKKLAEKVGGK